MEDNIVLDVADYSGRRVILHEERWNHHIQRRHPELIGCLRRVENTLRDPAFVYQAGELTSTHLYYRLGAIDRFRHLYLAVVVRLDLEPAQVRTAYLTGEPSRSKGRLVYVKARR